MAVTVITIYKVCTEALGLDGQLRHRALDTSGTRHHSPPAAVTLGALFSIVRVENGAKLKIRGNSHSMASVSEFHTQVQH